MHDYKATFRAQLRSQLSGFLAEYRGRNRVVLSRILRQVEKNTALEEETQENDEEAAKEKETKEIEITELRRWSVASFFYFVTMQLTTVGVSQQNQHQHESGK